MQPPDRETLLEVNMDLQSSGPEYPFGNKLCISQVDACATMIIAIPRCLLNVGYSPTPIR